MGEDENDLAEEDTDEKEVHEATEGDEDLDLVSSSDWLVKMLLTEEAESTDNERLASMPESEEWRRSADFAAVAEVKGKAGEEDDNGMLEHCGTRL